MVPVGLRLWLSAERNRSRLPRIKTRIDALSVSAGRWQDGELQQTWPIANGHKSAAEAEPLMRRTLEIDEQSFGPDHPKIATRLKNLSQLGHNQAEVTAELDKIFGTQLSSQT